MRTVLLFLFLSLLPASASGYFLGNPDTYPVMMSDDTTEYVISEVNWKARTYIGKRDTVAFDAMTDFFAHHLEKIYGGIQGSGMTPTGQPTGLYWHWDMENMRAFMAAAIPVDEVTAMIEGYEVIDIPTGKALVTDYFGPYEQSAAAHETFDAYVASNGMPAPSLVIEEYITDPQSVPDPSKWHTRITYVFVE